MRIRDVKKKIVVSKESLIYKDFFSAMYNEGYAVVIQPPSRRVVRISSSGEIYSQWGYDYDYDRHDFSGNFFFSFPHVVLAFAITMAPAQVTKRRNSIQDICE